MKLVQLVGNNDSALQQTQVEAAIAAKATAVVFSPVVPTAAGGALKEFADAKIPVIALRQDPMGGPVNSYVWVDFEGVGKFWGDYLKAHLISDVGHKPVRLAEILGDPTFEVYNRWTKGITPALNGLISSGQVKIVCKTDTKGFVPASAQAEMDQCLTTNAGNVDAVLVMQDSTGNGVAASLAKSKPARQGESTTAATTVTFRHLQRILLGYQAGTFHPDGKATALATVALVIAALQGKTPQSTGYINAKFMNGFYPDGATNVPRDRDARHRCQHAENRRRRWVPAEGQRSARPRSRTRPSASKSSGVEPALFSSSSVSRSPTAP